MNTMLINLVSTNAGWLARQAIKYSAVLAAVLTGWLIGHGFDPTHAGVIAAGAASIVLGIVEASLSFVARKYAVPELEGVNVAIEAAKKAPLIIAAMMALTSCAGLSAFITSPLGQATIISAEQLTKQLASAEVDSELEQIITKATAQIAALNAQGTQSDLLKEAKRNSEIVMFQGIISAAQQQYIGMTGHTFVVAKNPAPKVAP